MVVAPLYRRCQAHGDRKLRRVLVQGVDVLYWILPKIKDIDQINSMVLSSGDLSPEVRESVYGGQLMPEVDWALSLGSSAAFGAVVLFLAVRKFNRRDY